VSSRRFSQDDLIAIFSGVPPGSDVHLAFAQLLAERQFFRHAAPPYLRELCADVSRRAEDSTLDYICTELGEEAWRDARTRRLRRARLTAHPRCLALDV